MQNGRKPLTKPLLFLLAAAVLIKVFALYGHFVEAAYSTGVYPYIAVILRFLTGWLPFSLGDVLYAAAAIWLVVRVKKLLGILFKRKATWRGFLYGMGKTGIKLLCLYLVFNILWGLNYDRYGISYQLKLGQGKYNTEELKKLTDILIVRVNNSRRLLGDSNFTYPPNRQVFTAATNAYDNVITAYPFLRYRAKSIKPSIYGKLGNYLGFLGYYNPFTGEAQVNTTVPPFVIPYTTCHEMAHQLGYASEDEANFVGYLSAMASKDEIFHYSAYFDLFKYANGELFVRDSAAARANYRALDTLVKRDMHIYREFLLATRNPVEPVIRLFYGEYLKANNQPKGLETYNEVVAWLIAYQKKYGKL